MATIFFISNKLPKAPSLLKCLTHFSQLGYSMYWISSGTGTKVDITSLQYIDLLHPIKPWRQVRIFQLLSLYKPDHIVFYPPYPLLCFGIKNIFSELNFKVQVWTPDQPVNMLFNTLGGSFKKNLELSQIPLLEESSLTEEQSITLPFDSFYLIPTDNTWSKSKLQELIEEIFFKKLYNDNFLFTKMGAPIKRAIKNQISARFIDAGLEKNFYFFDNLSPTQFHDLSRQSYGTLKTSLLSPNTDLFSYVTSPDPQLARELFWNKFTREFLD